jgi:multiple sugar transport system permease protein
MAFLSRFPIFPFSLDYTHWMAGRLMTLREKIEAKNALLFVTPWIIGFLAFVAYPILASLYYSFCDYSVLSPPKWVGLYNYLEILRTPVAYRAIVRTFAFALVALPLSLVASLTLALLLERRARGVNVFRTIFFLPALVPQVAVAALLLWLFATDGVVNWALTGLGLPEVPWISRGTILVTLLVMGLWTLGHAMVIYLAGLHDVPVELYESAEIDGAGYLRRALHVSIPMISPVILFNLVMGIIAALGQFTIPYFITSTNTQQEFGDAANFIAPEIQQQAMQNLRMGYASALAWILLVAVIVLTALVLKMSSRVVHYQGE